MTVAKMKAGQRSPRNPLVVEILRDYGYVDARGMGIRTKVIPLMKHHNQTEPIFEATEDFLKTLLRKAQRHLNGDDVPSNASLKEKPPVSGAPKVHKPGRNAPEKASLTSFQMQLVARIKGNPSISYDVLAEKPDKDRILGGDRLIKVIDRLTKTVRSAAVFNPDVQAARSDRSGGGVRPGQARPQRGYARDQHTGSR